MSIDEDGALATSADIEAARTGDELAFRRLYRATQPGLERYVRVLAQSEAEDVCAEAWLQACRDLGRFKGDFDDFRAWIARIARNRALDLIRSQARRPSVPTDDEVLFAVSTQPSAEDDALETLSTQAALKMLAALPRDQAEAVMLRAVMGLDATRAGRVVGKRAGAVRTSAYRGLRTLADRLEHDAPRSDRERQ